MSDGQDWPVEDMTADPAKTTAVDDARKDQEEVCMPDYDPDHHVNEICADMCLQFDEEGLKRFDKDPTFQWLLRRAGEAEKRLAALPADWHVDSSLETWFPFSAEELTNAKAKVAELQAQLRQEREARCRDNEDSQRQGQIRDDVICQANETISQLRAGFELAISKLRVFLADDRETLSDCEMAEELIALASAALAATQPK